jgi:nitroreductase
VDVYTAIASKRDERRYDTGRAIPEDAATRILDAGRVAGSARNRQLWRFVVSESDEARTALAETVFVASNVLDAGLVVTIATPADAGPATKNMILDAGRAAQNMMLAAWDEGIVSCPNGIPDGEGAARALQLPADEQALTVLSFAYPARPRDPLTRPAAEWSKRADRKSLEEIVERV